MSSPSDTDAKPLEEESKLVRALIYGDFGQGKTTVAGNIVKAIGGEALTVTADSCWSVLYGIPDLQVSRIPYKSRDTADPKGKMRGTTFGLIWDIAKRYGDGSEYTTLLLDPVSTMVDISLRHYVNLKKFNDQRDPDVASWTHYGLVRNKLADLVAPLQNTKLNILYIAHLREPSEEEKAKGKIQARPSLPEATYKELAKECNLVGWCFKEKKGDKYLFQTEGTTREAAKSQIPTIAQTTYEQTEIPDLIRKWREG